MSEIEILEAVERLRAEWTDLFGEEDAQALARWLEATPHDDPEAVRRAANRVLDLLQRYPEVKARVLGQEEKGGGEDTMRGIYEPPPGGPDRVLASTIMVCPVDPGHYRRPLMQKGQRLYCPQHGRELVPEEHIRLEE